MATSHRFTHGLNVGDRVQFLPGNTCYQKGFRTGTVVHVNLTVREHLAAARERFGHAVADPLTQMYGATPGMLDSVFPVIELDPTPAYPVTTGLEVIAAPGEYALLGPANGPGAN